MKKIFLLSIHFIFCLNIFSQQVKDTSASDISYGIFKDLEFSKLKYIQKLIDRQPNYVVHVIPKDILYGTNTRSNDFRKDPLIKQNMSDSVDYWNSGYDRGHMAASADFKWNKKALSESYFYSNIIPQNHGLNQNSWNKLEMQVREWSIDNSELIVVTGPILKDNLSKIQQGSFKVSIPEYVYKIGTGLLKKKIKNYFFL